ncbi:MAG: SBBP repeat-containing protein [Acidobacteria bacterium]|nr:SBBP repeat-containing protein [Acidobacteriota bacterium]
MIRGWSNLIRSAQDSGKPKCCLYYPTEIRALDIDSNGDVYIAGNTWDSLRGVNPNIGPPTDPAANTDAWFAKYAGAAGTQIFISQFNTGNKDGFNALKADAANGLNTPLFSPGTRSFQERELRIRGRTVDEVFNALLRLSAVMETGCEQRISAETQVGRTI